jgi:hypothetical protein
VNAIDELSEITVERALASARRSTQETKLECGVKERQLRFMAKQSIYTERVNVRLSKAQREEAEAEAKRLGLGLATYLRTRMLLSDELSDAPSVETSADSSATSEAKPEAPAAKPRATGLFGRSRFGRSFMH